MLPPQRSCPHCGGSMMSAVVRTLFWHDDRPVIVEDVPALVCSGCSEQYYDEAVTEALHDLAAVGFPLETAVREISVPVFSLKGRIWRPTTDMDEAILD